MINGYFDIHSHILPGVDDGAKDINMTMKMIDEAYSQGVRTMVATPHYYPGHNNKSKAHIEKIYEEVSSVIKEKYSDFTLLLGNEIYYKDEVVEKLKNKEIFTLADTRYVLLEFPVMADYRYLYDAVQKCVNNGFYPVLAHIERYRCLYKNEDKVSELVKAGAYMQVNAENFKKGLFLLGRSFCMKLLQRKMIHFLGSDCHNMDERKPNMGLAVNYLEEKTEEEILRKILRENPQKLLDNRCI